MLVGSSEEKKTRTTNRHAHGRSVHHTCIPVCALDGTDWASEQQT